MDTSQIVPSPKLIWISLAINVVFCAAILPLVLQPGSELSPGQVLEALLWQVSGLIAWPVTLAMSSINPILSGVLPRLRDILPILLYPLIELFIFLAIAGKKNKAVFLALSHILILLSFSMLWTALLGGYNFMIG